MIFALKERLEHWPHRAITYILITFYLHCNQVFHFHAMQRKLKWDGNESKDKVDAQTIHAMVLIIVQLSLSSTWCILWDVIFWKSLFVSFVANTWWYYVYIIRHSNIFRIINLIRFLEILSLITMARVMAIRVLRIIELKAHFWIPKPMFV